MGRGSNFKCLTPRGHITLFLYITPTEIHIIRTHFFHWSRWQCQNCNLTPSWSVEEMRSNDVYFWCVWVIFRKSVIWPLGSKFRNLTPIKKNLWTKLNRLPGWKRVKTCFFYFSNKKKSVMIFFWSLPVVTGNQNVARTLALFFLNHMQKSLNR